MSEPERPQHRVTDDSDGWWLLLLVVGVIVLLVLWAGWLM